MEEDKPHNKNIIMLMGRLMGRNDSFLHAIMGRLALFHALNYTAHARYTLLTFWNSIILVLL